MKYSVHIILAFLIFCAAQNADSQWVQVNAPYGGNILCFATSGNNLFIGTEYGGVFLRTSGLVPKWSVRNNGLTNTHINALAAIGKNIFAGSENGLFRSTDNGQSWALLGFYDVNGGEAVVSMAVCDTDIFICLERGNGFFHSSDNGITWLPVHGLTYPILIAGIGKSLYASTDNKGSYYSPDKGVSWTPISNAVISSIIGIDSNILIGKDSGIFRSSDYGKHWKISNNGMPEGAGVTSFARNDLNIFAATDVGCIFLSTDNGENWFPVCNNVTMSGGINKIALCGKDLFAATGYQLLYKSSDYGLSWKKDGLTGYIRGLSLSGKNLFAGSDFGIFRSSDYGINWDQLAIPDIPIYSITNVHDTILAATDNDILISIDNGLSWVSNITNLSTKVNVFFNNGSDLLAGTYGSGINNSTDNGIHWTMQSNDTLGNAIFSFVRNGGDLLATTNIGICLSTDNGMSWTNVKSSSQRSVHSLILTGSSYVVGNDEGLFRSTDNGMYWTSVNYGFTGHSVHSLARSGSTLFAGTDAGVFSSTNDGTSWRGIQGGSNVFSVCITGSYIFSASGGGILRRPLSDFGINSVDEMPSMLEEKISISPNPGNGIGNLQYHLDKSSQVRIDIYDLLGRSIETIADQHEDVGEHSEHFDLSKYPPGTYFVSLRTGSDSRVQRLSIIR